MTEQVREAEKAMSSSDEESGGKSHAMRAVIALRQRILSGEFVGGTRLFEVPLAEQLNISRTPIREAMSRLVNEGLLDRGKSGGFTVRKFGFEDVIDAIDLRGLLEGAAARQAAERGITPEQAERLRELVAELDDCFGATPDDVDFELYSDLNGQFHALLMELPGNDILRREMERVNGLPFASPTAFMPDKADIEAFRRTLYIGQEHHRTLLQAILAGEGGRAEAIAREHARIARRNLDYVLKGDRSLVNKVPGLALVVD
ncbi:GntR family transcriptional regulator [Pseudoruegeria sp. HB172150]|uniref:GntR family transcriptional regulator n=1 Tax=Pseudoruegeria sp. HB172150 TaxID=2721164 RepID=UPI0020A6B5DC|nr:GntR family transcriptional regulator [Pseudoruegeria sp. HB172150]